MGELAAPVDPWPGAPIIIDDRYRRALRLIQRGSIMTHTPPEQPRPAYPHDGMLTQHTQRKRRVWPFLLVAPVLLLLCGIGVTVVAAAMDPGTAPGTDRSAGRFIAEPAPVPVPSPSGSEPGWRLTASDLKVSVDVRDKECYGSAGCNVQYRIDASVTDDVRKRLAGGEHAYDVRYEVRGFSDGKQIGTMQILPDGTFEQDDFQFGQTRRESSKLTVKVTRVERLL